jgi:hypothetical protein
VYHHCGPLSSHLPRSKRQMSWQCKRNVASPLRGQEGAPKSLCGNWSADFRCWLCLTMTPPFQLRSCERAGISTGGLAATSAFNRPRRQRARALTLRPARLAASCVLQNGERQQRVTRGNHPSLFARLLSDRPHDSMAFHVLHGDGSRVIQVLLAHRLSGRPSSTGNRTQSVKSASDTIERLHPLHFVIWPSRRADIDRRCRRRLVYHVSNPSHSGPWSANRCLTELTAVRFKGEKGGDEKMPRIGSSLRAVYKDLVRQAL